MVHVSVLRAGLLALIPATQATQFFYNSGTLDGWDFINREHEGTVDQVTNVVDKGTTAVKVTQTYDSSYTGRYHSELQHNDGYTVGQMRFYGFSFRLSETWEFDDQGYNIAQFIAHRPSNNCGDLDAPSTLIWIQGDQLMARVGQGPYTDSAGCSRTIKTFTETATVSSNVWHKVIIQANWQSDDTGFFKMWLDGNEFLQEFNLKTAYVDPTTYQYRVGLYANGWHDDGHIVGNQPFRQIWYDEIAVGDTFADVDPDQFLA